MTKQTTVVVIGSLRVKIIVVCDKRSLNVRGISQMNISLTVILV